MSNILISCTQAPGNGGAATGIYTMASILSKNLPNVFFYFLALKPQPNSNWFNPNKFDNCFGSHSLINDINKETKILLEKLKPTVVIGKNWGAPYHLHKNGAPNVYYLTSGFSPSQSYTKNGIGDFAVSQSYSKKLKFYFGTEYKTCDLCKNILPNSSLIRKLYKSNFPEYTNKLAQFDFVHSYFAAFSKEIYNIQQLKFKEKDIDICFVASRWSRPQKNNSFLKFINKYYKQYKIVLIGESDRENKKFSNIQSVGQVSHRKCLEIMNRSKVLIIPSLSDAAPNTQFEAYSLGTNVILSKDVGTSNLSPKEMIVDLTDKDSFDKVLLKSINKQNIGEVLTKKQLIELVDSYFSRLK